LFLLEFKRKRSSLTELHRGMCFIGAPSRSSSSLHAGRARARHTPSALQRGKTI